MPVPVIDIAQMRSWEAATWATGVTEASVIQRAGQAVATCAQQLTQPGERILILAGKGHNGDDAREAGRFLTGRDVQWLTVTDPQEDLVTLNQLLQLRPALMVDGLFGIGLNRPLSQDWIKLFEVLGSCPLPVLSVDVPSGLNADTGQPMGAALKATVTLTLGAPKKGLLTTAASEWVGRLEVAPEIGLVPCPFQSDLNWTLASDFSAYPPPRLAASHKGTFGHVVILAGSLGYHGAAVLAARGASAARPGLVTLVTHEKVYVPVASQLQSVMVHPWQDHFSLPATATALVVGPGLAAEDLPAGLKQQIREFWKKATLPIVADASALDWLPPGRITSKATRVVTPHPGEAARLLKATSAEVQDDRSRTVREVSIRLGYCWVVLKGHQTIIGRSSGDLYVNSSGNPYLAQGGSGDVLAGFLGGLLAQPSLQVDPVQAIRYAVWQHGATADALQCRCKNWTIAHLVDQLGEARP